MQKTWQKLKENPAFWQRYFVREKVLSAIREFFSHRDYHEVEAPLLAPSLPPESYLEVFETTLLDRHRKKLPAYLTASPEMFLKKLLVAGIGNCYSLCKSFRNTEDFSDLHNHEFTMLEWYHVNADYTDLMDETEELFLFIHRKLNKPVKNDEPVLVYQGKEISLIAPWERVSMVEAFKKYAKMNLERFLTLGKIASIAKKKGYKVTHDNTWEQLFNQIYLNEVEPHLGRGRPTILYDFPSQMAALSRKKKDDPRFAERFEIFIEGLELGDAYSELSDWKEQEERFRQEVKQRRRLGKIDHPYDKDFIEALKAGLPRCAGLAMGVDRVLMLFADTKRIQDTLFFPVEEMWEK